MRYQVGKERIYNQSFPNRNDVILWDVQKISNEQLLKVTFVSTNPPRRQGIRLATDKGIEVNGQISPAIRLWEDTAPKEILCKCYTNDGLLSIYNIWDEQNNGFGSSQADSSGMLLEEKGNILIYRCNDYGFKTNFDSLVFSIEKL